jgi:salicylate hydroxylase
VRNIEGDMSFWALTELPRLPRWSRGRVVLLGDAAHAPLPHQGQGAAMAIEDAYALGALLGTGGLADYGAAFAAFENLRRHRARLVQAYSRGRRVGVQIRRRRGGQTGRKLAVAAGADWLDSQVPGGGGRARRRRPASS